MIHLNIVNRTSRDALELLKLGNVDLAFVNLPLEEEAVEMRPYRQVQDIFVAGSRFRFLEDRVVPLGELDTVSSDFSLNGHPIPGVMWKLFSE